MSNRIGMHASKNSQNRMVFFQWVGKKPMNPFLVICILLVLLHVGMPTTVGLQQRKPMAEITPQSVARMQKKPTIEPRSVRTDVGQSCDDNDPLAPECPEGQICSQRTYTCIPKYSTAESRIEVAQEQHRTEQQSLSSRGYVGQSCDDNDSRAPKCPKGQICSQRTYTCLPKSSGGDLDNSWVQYAHPEEGLLEKISSYGYKQ